MKTESFSVIQSVPADSIDSLLTSAIETNACSYWMHAGADDINKGDSYLESLELGGTISVFDEEDNDKEPKRYLMTFDKVKEGIDKLSKSKEYSHHWRDLMNEDADNVTADVFMQFCLFGEVKYS